MPNKLEDWVTLVFSQEFIDKVKTYEDYNFMGLFIFDRVEMTFSYAQLASELLEEVGLLSHTIVFLVFLKFLAHHVMNNSPPLLR